MDDMISVIIPIYNVSDYLSHCLDSVLAQTYKKIEIILVDDGSTDRSGEICDEYALKDSRIKVIHKNNGGLSEARNLGIDISKGKYITFIDSDDWVDDSYIEKLYSLVITRNCDIAVCGYMRTSSESSEDIKKSLSWEIHEFTNLEALSQFADRLNVQMVIACGKLYDKSLFEDIRFPVGKFHEDEFTTHKLIYKSRKIALTTEKLLNYRQRQDSITGSCFNLGNKLHAMEAIKERAEFFRCIGMDELSGKTYRMLFKMYLSTNRVVEKSMDDGLYCEYKSNFKKMKTILRKSEQPFIFRVYYELYYITPKAMDFALRIYRLFKKEIDDRI